MRTCRCSGAAARDATSVPVDGQEALVRVLGVDARLDRVAVDRKLLLRQRQRLAGGDAQLPLDQVEAR